jgi:hypothetical protein
MICLRELLYLRLLLVWGDGHLGCWREGFAVRRCENGG